MLGKTLGSYRIVKELGVGGMGTVYLAELIKREPFANRGDRMALKIVHPHLLGAPGFFKRFLREAEIGKSVDHQNVVRTYDADALSLDDRQYHFL